MRAFERAIADLAPTNIPVLLGGESGTGKDAFALEMHRRSRRSDQPFLKFICAKLNAELLAKQLAVKADDSPGGGASACQGTVFLDEISQLDSSSQESLLRLLPDADVAESAGYRGPRWICATTRNLEEEMRGGRFRRDLYYRISCAYLYLPPLRDRKEDLPVLLDIFLNKYGRLFGRAVPSLDAVLDATLRYSWPGNVRELENCARMIIALGDANLALSHLGIDSDAAQPASVSNGVTTRNHVCSLKKAAR